MFINATPESIGVSSKTVKRFIDLLNQRSFFMHSILLAKGNKLFCEAYYEPYERDNIHRMYSVTKSYIGVAVCDMADKGLISLDDSIVKYFSDMLPENPHPFWQAQTIRSMLKMQTCLYDNYWFTKADDDRVKYYFSCKPHHHPETGFRYDSDGSFILGVLIERVTGKRPLEYLKEVCLDEIGFSADTRCLDALGGYPWGDSAFLCRPIDTLSFGRLLANGGEWNGKQLLSKKTVEQVLGNYTDTHSFGQHFYDAHGYGYQVWHSYTEGFAFLGMHSQYVFYDKATDIMLMCTGGNVSGIPGEIISTLFYTVIVDGAGAEALPENTSAQKELSDLFATLKIPVVRGKKASKLEKEINNKTFIPEDNPMGIKKFSFSFGESEGEFRYTNAQGDKVLKFGKGKNIIQQFPEKGYSSTTGRVKDMNNTYRCAVSAAWNEENRLGISVQIIDDYIGILNISVGFKGKHAWLQMFKEAEDFLWTYEGTAAAQMVD